MPIRFEHVGHTYSAGTPYEYKALKDVKVMAPVKRNDVIVENVLGLGVDIIASRSVE